MGTARHSRISLDRIAEARTRIDPPMLNSPHLVCESLNRRLGAELLLKLETLNPIRSFKGRGAEYFTATLPAPQPLVCASAGNFGQALAYAATRRGIAVTVFTATNANPLKVLRMRELGARVQQAGLDFDTAKEQAAAFAEKEGALFVEDGREAAITEGAGTIGVELEEECRSLDCVVLPVGNGALIAGAGAWLKARCPRLRIAGVCAAGASCMADSWQLGRPVSTAEARTIADGIAVRTPVPEALADMRGVVDEMLLVDDTAIVAGMKLLFEEAGLVAEPAGAAGVAALLTHKTRFTGQRAATVICGSNITAEQMRHWLM